MREESSSVSWRVWKRRRTHRGTSPSCQILIPHESQDEQPPLEQFEEVAAQDFDEAMM